MVSGQPPDQLRGGSEGSIEAISPNGRRRHVILPALEGRGGHKPWFSPDGSRRAGEAARSGEVRAGAAGARVA